MKIPSGISISPCGSCRNEQHVLNTFPAHIMSEQQRTIGINGAGAIGASLLRLDIDML